MSVSDKIGQPLLYVVRHANVAMDSRGTMRGLENPSLDELGRQQAAQLVEFFYDRPLSGISTDDLKRTQQTMLEISSPKRLEVSIDIDLRSWDIGPDLEGKSIEAHRDEIVQLKSQPWIVPVGGQSWGEYETQTLESFYRYVRKGMDAMYPWAIGAHGSYIQVVAVELGMIDKQHEYDSTPIEPSGVICVFLTRQGLRGRILRGAKETSDE